MTQFSELNLIEPLQRAVADQGFTSATEIQAQAIPSLLEGKDVVGVAQTGGGKTAAFVLPILQRLWEEKIRNTPRHPRAVILAPTREIAQQITDQIKIFARHLRLFYTAVYGGAPMFHQFRALERGVDILVATPGRLMDHVSRGSVKFDHTTIFVLDEADRMLDLGFADEVQAIADSLPEEHQTILFSATMPKAVDRLTQRLVKDPVRIETAPTSTVAASVEQKIYQVHGGQKQELLSHILEQQPKSRVLVFMQTKAEADRWCDFLRDEGHRADAIHGDKPQKIRAKVLNKFRRGMIDILVATDVAARGIDVPGIDLVVNIDLPTDPESYVHRIGRTGRAQATGQAFSFCSPKEIGTLRRIESNIRDSITVETDHPFHVEISRSRNANGPKGNGKGKFNRNGGPKSSNGPKKNGGKPFGKFAKGGQNKRRFEGNDGEKGRDFHGQGQRRFNRKAA